MTLVSFGDSIAIPPRWPVAGTPTESYQTISAANEKVGFVLRAPATGTISKVMFSTGTVTTGATVDVRLETVSTTTGKPTGTLLDTNTNASLVIADGDDDTSHLVSLTAGAAVTQGDIFAVVISNPGASFGNMRIIHIGTGTASPYIGLYSGAAWTMAAGSPVLAFEYDDGSYPALFGCYPYEDIIYTSYNNTDTPDVYALRFKFAFPARLSGAHLQVDADGDFDVKLYDTDGATVLGTISKDKDIRGVDTIRGYILQCCDEIVLTKDAWYRLGVEPTSATDIRIATVTVGSADYWDATHMGQNMILSTAKDPSQESDWTQDTTKRPMFGLYVDQLDDGDGAFSAVELAY